MSSAFRKITKKCLICDKVLKLRATRDIERTKFCSKICQNKGHSKRMTGRTHTSETRLILSRSAKKRGLGKVFGLNHPNWKGGLSSPNEKIRTSFKYVEWRKEVFFRDKWTCQHCGQVGGGLHAHHIMSFSKYPFLQLDINNGITLCVPCHSQVHNRNFSGKERLANG